MCGNINNHDGIAMWIYRQNNETSQSTTISGKHKSRSIENTIVYWHESLCPSHPRTFVSPSSVCSCASPCFFTYVCIFMPPAPFLKGRGFRVRGLRGMVSKGGAFGEGPQGEDIWGKGIRGERRGLSGWAVRGGVQGCA